MLPKMMEAAATMSHPDEESTEEDMNETPKMEKVEEMSIPLPPGFAVPENAKNGEMFEVITKAKVKDGRLIFESFDGQSTKPEEGMGDSDEEAETTLRDAVRQERMM